MRFTPRVLLASLAVALVAAVLPPVTASATTSIPAGVALFDVALTPDGNYAYAVGFNVNDQGKLYRIDLADNSMVEVLTGLMRPMDVAITNDGARIAVGGYGRVYMIDPANPSTDDSWVNGWGDVGGLAVSNNAVYAARNDNGALARFVRSGGSWPAPTAWAEMWSGVAGIWHDGIAVSRDDSVLLMGGDGEIRKFVDPLNCTAPCNPTQIPGTNESGVAGIAISPDGSFAYYARNNQASFRRLDLTTDTVSSITGDSGAGSRDVAISADGAYAYLVYTGEHSRNPSINQVRTSDNTVIATVSPPVIPCKSNPRAIATSPINSTFMVAAAGATADGVVPCPTLGGAAYRFPTTAEPPTGLAVTSGNGSADISFTAGADGLSAITNYEYSDDSGATWTALSPADATSPITVTGLTNGVAATITLRAVNGAGSGSASASVTVTPAAPPGAPTITAVDWDDTTASIYFAPPASDGGAPITTYEYSLDAGANWNSRTDGGGTASPIVVTGLTTSTTYSIDVRAMNSAGGGTTPPTPVIVTPGAPHTPPAPPPTYPPGAPQQVVAVPGERSATVSWSAPASSGSFAVTHYQVSAYPGGNTCLTELTTCTVTGLTAGTSYTFTVKALNGAGWGTWSSASDPVVPTAPSIASITITGSRAGKVVKVTGRTSGLAAGTVLTPWVRVASRALFRTGTRTVTVAEDGTFTWKRRSLRALSVYFESGGTMSNELTVGWLRR